MGFEPYIFAAFIFLLICVLLFLYRRFIVLPKGKRLSDDAEAQGREKEERLFRLYQNIEEMMDNFEGYLEDTRGQMELVKAEMGRQQREIGELIERAEAIEARALSAIDTTSAAERRAARQGAQQGIEPEKQVVSGKKGKQDAVREQLNKGLTVEQIAQKLGLSINEVKLVVYGMMSKPVEKK